MRYARAREGMCFYSTRKALAGVSLLIQAGDLWSDLPASRQARRLAQRCATNVVFTGAVRESRSSWVQFLPAAPLFESPQRELRAFSFWSSVAQ